MIQDRRSHAARGPRRRSCAPFDCASPNTRSRPGHESSSSRSVGFIHADRFLHRLSALVRGVWQSQKLGPVGQVYRLGLTAVLGIKIGVQSALGVFE